MKIIKLKGEKICDAEYITRVEDMKYHTWRKRVKRIIIGEIKIDLCPKCFRQLKELMNEDS